MKIKDGKHGLYCEHIDYMNVDSAYYLSAKASRRISAQTKIVTQKRTKMNTIVAHVVNYTFCELCPTNQIIVTTICNMI